MADFGLWTGLERATGRMAATGMNLLEFQANKQIQEDKLTLMKEQAGREATAFKNTQEDRAAKQKQLKAFVPASLISPEIHQIPEAKNLYIKTLRNAGFEVKETPDEVYPTVEGLAFLKQIKSTSLDFQKLEADALLTDLQGQNAAIGEKIAQLQESGKTDEKVLAPLQQKQMSIRQRIASIMTVQKDVMAELLKTQAKPEGSQTEEQLTARALKGDAEAKAILDAMQQRKIDIARNTKAATVNIQPSYGAPMGTIPQVQPGEKNAAALQGVSAGDQAIIKSLTEYKMPLPSGFALKSPYWQNILQRASAYDPSFDASQYNVRLKVRQDFTSGKAAINIRSLNTAVAHLDTLKKKADALDNAPIQVWNWIANRGISAVGDKRVVEFNNAATAVESELAAVFKGMGATDQEIKQWRANMSSAQSPEQLKGGINTAIELLGGRLGALQSQYETGLGKPKAFRFLSARSQQILQRLGVDINAVDPVSKQGGTPASPASERTIVEQRKTKDGRILTKYSDGSIE